MRVHFGPAQLVLVQGDLTEQEVDAIVNAANSGLAGGGGVDGAIHRAGGPSLMEEPRRRYPQGCRTGDAVPTAAGLLRARYVFHAVGPVWHGGGQREEELLASCYRRSLEVAHGLGINSIAFPAISTGIYGFPAERAAKIAIREVQEHAHSLEVVFVCFDSETVLIYLSFRIIRVTQRSAFFNSSICRF